MRFITQNRAELGSDPELAEAFRKAGVEMLYVGVESSNAENLKGQHGSGELDDGEQDRGDDEREDRERRGDHAGNGRIDELLLVTQGRCVRERVWRIAVKDVARRFPERLVVEAEVLADGEAGDEEDSEGDRRKRTEEDFVSGDL